MTSPGTKELSVKHQLSIRSDGQVKLALDMVVARLRSRGNVRYKGLRVTQEAVVNAAFLMLADMDDAELEKTMGHYVGALEELLRGDAADPPSAQERPDGPPRVVAMQDTTEALRREIREKSKPKRVEPKSKTKKP